MLAVLAGHGDGGRDDADQLDDVCEVVLVPAVVLARVRLEQVVPGGELEGHAGRAPDVCRGPVAGAEQHLQRAVLPGLDILRVVVVLYTNILYGVNNCASCILSYLNKLFIV